MLLPLFTLAALSAAVLADDSQCNALTLVGCVALIDRNQIKDDTLSETAEDLDSKCAASIKGFQCLHDFTVNCPDMAEMEHLGPFFQAQLHIIKKICTDGNELRNRYLKSAKCINEHRPQTEKKCGVLEETFTKDHCIKTQENIKCIFGEVEDNCGEDTLNTMKELLLPLEKLLENVCKNASPNIPHSLHPALRLF